MKVLVLGGTGAMGVHVTRLLAEEGHDVAVTSRRDREERGGVRYAKGNAKDPAFLESLLSERWGAVVDFMVWSTAEFRERYRKLLAATDQYVFVSSYRVYADSPVITEDSPRLLDVCGDAEYLATDEYALAKARCEDMLFTSGGSNWTVVRPAITYDGSGRFQLGVHEAELWLWRALKGIPVPLPGVMLGKQATMTWGGDVARMIVGLVGNPEALGEAFTVSTSEHLAWSDIASIYRSIVPDLEVAACGLEEFERERGGVYQIRYDRMFDRVVDNSRVLAATGIDPSSLASMERGLVTEISRFLEQGGVESCGIGMQARMDRLVGGCPSLSFLVEERGLVAAAKYCVRRFVR